VFNYFRSHLASQNGLATPDAIGLLRVLGGDCAGAVQLLPEGTSPNGREEAMPMTDEEVANVVEALPTWDLPDDFAITAALGGIQSKVLLSRHGGRWMWPGRGAVSTHIIKPEPLDSPIPRLLPAEDWALKVAAAAGRGSPAGNLRRACCSTRQARTPVMHSAGRRG
jgi:serine/threonine-protein kinase HipA